MKNLLIITLSLLSMVTMAQRYATNVIEDIDYEVVEETNKGMNSVVDGKTLNYRTVRVTDHKKKENGVLKLKYTWKSYYLEIDKDLYSFSSKQDGVKSSKLKDTMLMEKSCDDTTLTVLVKTKTIDPKEFNQQGIVHLTKTKKGSITIDTSKHCNGLMPRNVVIKTL